ncbi:hypothetical protein [Rhodoferax antarcticus]|uniref:Uncharacterized protein n=1 Tax=Rhodoferax antarcticus ANT.BR TaxID=1111071 RepID=A0A1Q8YCY1_9BURK|nr:hypothetical protein [Rhodoferax antarcticus]MCW2310672.1 hypothetical protein [Rhodoferax antarcticus]OLP05911.1 hypothetical protein BLL52_2140 [Rhodoferax antarcticus ANT.BR]
MQPLSPPGFALTFKRAEAELEVQTRTAAAAMAFECLNSSLIDPLAPDTPKPPGSASVARDGHLFQANGC